MNFNQDSTCQRSLMIKHNPSELVEKDENFKRIFEKLMQGNEKFIESRKRLIESDEVEIFFNNSKNKAISDSNKYTKINTTLNSLQNIKKINNLDNKNTKFFVFTCTDCEIDIPALFSFNPEDVFIYKNIGNIITLEDVNLIFAIQYAIETLNIKNFIILGHTSCSALKEAIYPSKNGIINKWLKNIRLIAEENRHLLYESKRDFENYEFNFSQINIKEQMKRFSELRFIQSIIKRLEKVYIYGFQLQNSNGKIKDIEVLHSIV
jgi:carbonic anhydrase